MHNVVNVYTKNLTIPTYEVSPRSALPPFLEPESTYPYNSFLLTADKPRDKKYQAVIVENSEVRVTVLPELGGRILQIEDTKSGRNYLHENDVVRPVRISMRFAFISLGIELNFPFTHSPTGINPVGYEIIQNELGAAGVAVGEKELMWGLCWRAEIKLFPNSRAVCVSVRCWNPTDTLREVEWWSNAAQPVGADTEFIFPEEPVIAHSDKEEIGQWPLIGGTDRRWHKSYDNMFGLFWEPTKTDWFGIYHYGLGKGLLHLASPDELPGKKLWTFGQTGPVADWTLDMTRNGGVSCEIQSGIPTTQKTRLTLKPGQDFKFIEFWEPVDSRQELADEHRLTYASLIKTWGGTESIYAPKVEINSPAGKFWKELANACNENNLHWLDNNRSGLFTVWPPTGLELEPALTWAANSKFKEWKYPLAVWYCARHQWEKAASVLKTMIACAHVHALLGYVEWKGFARKDKAWFFFREALQELPDGGLFVLANGLLRESGRLSERQFLLDLWPDGDYRKRETMAEHALDSGDAHKALEVLTGQPWVRHHGRYRRTELWIQACKQLSLPVRPVPLILNEDPYRVTD